MGAWGAGPYDNDDAADWLSDIETRGVGTNAAERADGIELKLDGLTHAVIAGFGSLVHELDAVKERIGRLERERA